MEWRNGIKVKEYGTELFERAKIKIKNDTDLAREDILNCPSCGFLCYVRVEHKEAKCYVCGHTDDIGICDGCNCAFVPELSDCEDEKYCSESCLEYYSDDFWYESSVGK